MQPVEDCWPKQFGEINSFHGAQSVLSYDAPSIADAQGRAPPAGIPAGLPRARSLDDDLMALDLAPLAEAPAPAHRPSSAPPFTSAAAHDTGGALWGAEMELIDESRPVAPVPGASPPTDAPPSPVRITAFPEIAESTAAPSRKRPRDDAEPGLPAAPPPRPVRTAAIEAAFRVARQRPLLVDEVAALLTAPSEALDMAPRPGCGTQSWTLYLEHSREHRKFGREIVKTVRTGCFPSLPRAPPRPPFILPASMAVSWDDHVQYLFRFLIRFATCAGPVAQQRRAQGRDEHAAVRPEHPLRHHPALRRGAVPHPRDHAAFP